MGPNVGWIVVRSLGRIVVRSLGRAVVRGLKRMVVRTGERKEKFTIRGDVKIPLLKLVTFCRKTSNVCWWSFVDQLHPHHMLGSKVTWVTTASWCYTILGNVFLLNGGSSHQPSAKA